MKKNKPTGDNYRVKSVKDRSQVVDTIRKLYVKRNTDNGQLIDTEITGG